MNKIQIIRKIIIAISLGGLIPIGYIRYTNPQLTEAELFLEYWFQFLLCAGLILPGIWAIRQE